MELAKETPPIAEATPAPEAAQERAEELSAMKVAELKALCKERGLLGKGRKAGKEGAGCWAREGKLMI